jgi:phosphonate transport system permease protein
MKISCLKMKNWLNKLTHRHRSLTLTDGTTTTRPLQFDWFYMLLILFIVVFFYQYIIGAYFEVISYPFFFSRVPNFFTILQAMVSDVNWAYFPQILDPLFDTIKMAFLGTLMGSLFALPVSFLASQNIIKNRFVSITVKFLLSFVRTLPSILYALIFAFVFGYGTFVGTLSLTVFTFAISSKILYEYIETLDMGAFTAIESTGATKLQAFTASILPQLYGNFFSTSLYSFEINIRYSAILGFVGAGGIGILLNDAMSLRRYGNVSVLLLGLLALVLVTENISRAIRKRLN